MELRQLRAFTEVVRTGTFRAAASALHLTQPALWQQVRSLQDELGLQLFERVGRRASVQSRSSSLHTTAWDKAPVSTLCASARPRRSAGEGGRAFAGSAATSSPTRTHFAPTMCWTRVANSGDDR